MKYTNPVCEIYTLNDEDVITTSVVIKPGDAPVVPASQGNNVGGSVMGNDYGVGGSASN